MSSTSNSSAATPGGVFATTRWTVVISAGHRNAAEADQALNELCRLYWYPLYAYVRRHGYDREWATVLLERVLVRLQTESEADGKGPWFSRLKAFLVAGDPVASYVAAAVDLGQAEGAIRTAVHRLRKRYRELLREEIAQTVSAPAQVEEEMRALFQAFVA